MRLLASLVIAFSTLFGGGEGEKLNPHELASYMDQSLVDFVRPGLKFEIKSAVVGPDMKVRVTFTVSDNKNLPLDRDGVYSPGPVTSSFILAAIPKGQSQHVAYTTRTVTSPITGVTAVQASADSGGTYAKIADGVYVYTFGKPLPATFDSTVTHTVAMYGRRDLTEFELGRQVDNATLDWVPNGSPVTVVRDVVRTETCNSCHDVLAAHGGQRTDVALCVTCHTSQTKDPDTGNTVDMKVMIHKIHAGPNLPSVKEGKPYKIIGNSQSVHDYSHTTFPTAVNNCAICHDGTATQANNWLLEPTRETCGSCHDDVNFYTGVNHVGGRAISDKNCATCHIAEGELEFDASIKGAHTIPTRSRDLPGVKFEVLEIQNTQPGQQPTVTVKVTDKSGFPIETSQMTSLSLIIAGPNADYATYWSESAAKTKSENGIVVYTFTKGFPADAKGSYTLGVEGYRYITLLPGTTHEIKNVRDAAVNVTKAFTVTDFAPVERRKVVATEKCNSCHGNLSLHGGNRNRVEQCVLCHNPNWDDKSRRLADKLPPESINFGTMVHKIHTGEELKAEFTIYGRSSNPVNFNEVQYPGDRRNCLKCHVDGSEQLPLAQGLLPVNAPRDLIDPMGTATAACLACHGGQEAASHALLNTSTLGESCAVCHGQNKEFSVNKSHAR